MSIPDFCFVLLSVAAFFICWAFVVIEPKRDPFSSASCWAPGAAGFSFFPVINIAVAAAILCYWANRPYR